MATERPVGRGRMDVAVTFALLALGAAIVAAVAWTRPTMTASTHTYTQFGSLAYSAPASATSVYGSAGLTTGEPVYASVVSTVTVTYSYQFQSDPPAAIHGVEQLVATLSNGAGLSRAIPLQQLTPFSGDHFAANAAVRLATIDAVVKAFDKAAGSRSGGNYQVAISPSVHVVGTIASSTVGASFNPATTFSYGGGVLTPGSSGGSPGAPPAQQFANSAPGTVTVPDGQTATLALGIPVETARLASLAVLFGSLVICAVAGIPYWRRATSDDEVARIMARHGASMVEVDAVDVHPGVVVVELQSFDGMLQVSRRLECPILHWAEAGDVYAVIDGTTLYRYRPHPLPTSLPLRPVEPDGGWSHHARGG